MGVTKPPIPVTGVWLRKIGDEVHVLVEHEGVWKLAITENIDGHFSHIVEQSGIEKAPDDPLGVPT